MKILIVSQWFVSKGSDGMVIPGGTERYSYGLAKQLQEDGHTVMVLSTTTDKELAGLKVLNGISIYRFKIPERFYGYLADFLCFINLLKQKEFNPDIIHIVSTGYRFAFGGIIASKIMKKKTVYTITLIPFKEGRGRLPIFLDKFIFSKTVGWSDVIIALSKEMKEILAKEVHHKKIVVIPSFFTESYCEEGNKDKAHNSILFVGRLAVAHKGVDFLIKAMNYVVKEIPSAKLNLVGEGPSLNYLKELVSEYGLGNNIIFCGHIDEDQLFEMYFKNEILAMPSLREGMPMVLLEAMSAGLPIVAFDIECIKEALEDGKHGILVKKGEIKELANQIIRLLNNDELREYYSRMSLERSKRYSQDEVVRDIEKIYLSI
ncbi:MAG: Glycosyltransferase Gtf1 [Candidatus Argoarchaeum ethanivorans]|uniref:Glycosyltransferase Gtf1 n=1 Tax=Candidatus Argoarchaeum ethanivorans TaxID=2608793 RepID=A0A811TBR1_9EURY|nr:MAG: Glycosyltransferase Gtf1 [Candidatus Argoarchaeum ethanivorans]